VAAGHGVALRRAAGLAGVAAGAAFLGMALTG
jgi:hypothetical protein